MNAMDLRLMTEEAKETREKKLTEQAKTFYAERLLPVMTARARDGYVEVRLLRQLAYNAVSIPHLVAVLEDNGFFVDDGIITQNIITISW